MANDTISRLNNLVGGKGVVKVQDGREFRFKVLSVHLPKHVPVTDDYESAVEFSTFTVSLDEGLQFDGKNILDIHGSAITKVDPPPKSE